MKTKIFILTTITLLSTLFNKGASAQNYTNPNWWFGPAVGGNINFYNGSTQNLGDITIPKAVHKGLGLGLFISPLVEYHNSNSKWGFMFQAAYDSRKGNFYKVNTPCNCPEDVQTKLSYLSIEPSLRFNPFENDFYVFGGSVLGFNINKSYTYQLENSPQNSSNPKPALVKGNFSEINPIILSAHIGVGYDIRFNSTTSKYQYILSPFLTYLPYLGQTPRSIETWSINTLRTGLIFKIGRKRNAGIIEKESQIIESTSLEYSINSPRNNNQERRIRETFPIRNYVFFDEKKTTIPDRYVLIKKSETKDFKEDQLEVLSPKRLTGRSDREMIVYYNILNILGDRMQKNPSAKIKLVGSSENGPVEGEEMATSIKKYLEDTWSIESYRMIIEGNDKPKIPSENVGGNKELIALSEGNRRVSIESTSDVLLMEFQSGPDAPLKPVEINTLNLRGKDTSIIIIVKNAKENFEFWNIEFEDNNKKKLKFGPYVNDEVLIPSKSILGDKKEDTFKAKVTAKTKNGKTLTKESDVNLSLWRVTKNEMGLRYSVLFEYNDSRAIDIYDKYLTEIIAPKIPINAIVTIHGHTDNIGDFAKNKALSERRAEEVKNILSNALAKLGRSDVKFFVEGYGENVLESPFNNQYPEERFYNRTVIIDINPKQ